MKFCTGIAAYHRARGMWPYQMTYALKVLRMQFKKRRKFTVTDLDQLLKSGGSLILIYDTLSAGSHAVFVDGICDEGYRVWNKGKAMDEVWTRKLYVHNALERSGKRPGHLYAFTFAKPETKGKVKA